MNVGELRAEAARGFIAHDDLRIPNEVLARTRHRDAALVPAESLAPLGDVVQYQLRDLVQLADAHQRPATGLLRQLLTAASARDRERVIRRRLDDVGFEWLAYYTLTRLANGSIRRSCLMTFAHVEWTRRYFEQSYHDLDPRHEQIRQSSLPMVWDADCVEDALVERAQTPRVRGFTQELRASGMGSGVFVRVASEAHSPVQHGVISLGSSVSSRRWIDDRVLGEALVIGLSLHDYASHHVQMVDDAVETSDACLHASGLPAKQQAVLRHVADGLTDRAIAQKLGVSLHTVDYYLRQLRQHFAVHNRVQLLAAASHLLG